MSPAATDWDGMKMRITAEMEELDRKEKEILERKDKPKRRTFELVDELRSIAGHNHR